MHCKSEIFSHHFSQVQKCHSVALTVTLTLTVTLILMVTLTFGDIDTDSVHCKIEIFSHHFRGA